MRILFAIGLCALALSCEKSEVAGGDGGNSNTGSGGAAANCEGGVVIDGACVAKCDASKCLEKNVCVENACKLTCDSHADCANGPGTQCTPAKDDGGANVNVCLPTAHSPSVGMKCPEGDECEGKFACPDGSACDPEKGEGTCAKEACRALYCTGAGQGDTDAYCTYWDCTAEAPCPGGYECQRVRDFHKLCDKDKTSWAKELPCVAEADYQKDGATYIEGPLTLLRNTCLKREQCGACETDLDCSYSPGEACIDIGGEMRCSRACKRDADCELDYACDEGKGRCLPKAGTCVGEGNYCEPCLDDMDCGGDISSFKGCRVETPGGKFCFDFSYPDQCTTSADCPQAPSGKYGECLSSKYGSLAGRCGPPYRESSYTFTCW